MSDDKSNVPSTTSGNKGAVELHGSGLKAGAILDSAVSRLSPDQVQNLVGKAAEEALRLEVKHHEQNADYAAGKRVVQDHVESFRMMDKSGKFTRHEIETDVKTGAGQMKITSKSGATCFVATAAYGDPAHPDVVFLRWYRDNYLVKSMWGRGFIDIYWCIGPKLAWVVSRSSKVKSATLSVLTMLVATLKKRKKTL